MSLPSQDANPKPDETSSSSTTTDATAASSTATTEDAKPKDFESEAIAEFEKTHTVEGSEEQAGSSPATGQETAKAGTEGAEAKNGIVPLSDKTKEAEGTDSTKGKKEEDATKDKDKDKEKPKTVDDTQLPFHKHERFQELLRKEKEATTQWEQAKPIVERMEKLNSYLEQNHIPNEQFMDGLRIMALANTNPVEARKALQPLLDYLDGFNGEKLPEDLVKEVEAGTLPLVRAKEIAGLRTQKTFVEQRGQQTAAQNHSSAVATALTNWETMIGSKDPEYSRKAQLVNSVYVVSQANAEQRLGRKLTPAEHTQLAQQAYDQINSYGLLFVPKPPTTKNLSTNGSHATAKTEPKSWDEVEDFLVSRFK